MLIDPLHGVDALLLLQPLDEVSVEDRSVQVLQRKFIKVCLQGNGTKFTLKTRSKGKKDRKEKYCTCTNRNVPGWDGEARICSVVHPVEQALVIDLFFIVPKEEEEHH